MTETSIADLDQCHGKKRVTEKRVDLHVFGMLDLNGTKARLVVKCDLYQTEEKDGKKKYMYLALKTESANMRL